MNFLDFFENHKKQEIEHFYHLVQIAMADEVFTEQEKDALYNIGHKIGFSDPEVDIMIKESSKKTGFVPPYELYKRFERMYDIMKMVLSDGIIDEKESRLANNLAEKYGFTENEIPDLLGHIIEGIRNGLDEEDSFNSYKKKKAAKQRI